MGIDNVFRVSALSVFLMFCCDVAFLIGSRHAPGEQARQALGRPQEHVRSAGQVRLMVFSPDFLRLLGRVLAGVRGAAAVLAGLCGSQCQD